MAVRRLVVWPNRLTPQEIDAQYPDCQGQTFLMEAAVRGHADICHLLVVDGKAMVDAHNKRGSTALMVAAYEGHVAICRLLVEAGAGVNMQNKHGYTALMLAAYQGMWIAAVCWWMGGPTGRS